MILTQIDLKWSFFHIRWRRKLF